MLPGCAEIVDVRDLTAVKDTKLFRLKEHGISWEPGQFVMVGRLGIGESPISITSHPGSEYLELCIKNMGMVTDYLHKLGPGEKVTLRGPYGRPFPCSELKGRNIIFLGGGIGLAPLRSLINHVLENPGDYGNVKILYGARTPGDIIFKDELERWAEKVEVLTTVDVGDDTWQGNVGVVTTLFQKTEMNPENTKVVMCGPPVMIKFAARDLVNLNFRAQDIIITLERKMHCGIGKCGHCMIGPKHVCTDGPVFTYDEIPEPL